MAIGAYSLINDSLKNAPRDVTQRRLIEWRASDAAVNVDKPLNIGRARMLGYKAKKGFVVIRIRAKRGGKQRSRHTHGRKSRKQHVRKILKMNHQWIAEIRAQKKYPNLEVLSSYQIGKDGKHNFFEVIMVDPSRPEIKNDKTINWICESQNRDRALRGLTSAARKSRGLRTKSPDAKVRPSMRAWKRRGK
jgi:large subunit ribosomal protein L15e